MNPFLLNIKKVKWLNIKYVRSEKWHVEGKPSREFYLFIDKRMKAFLVGHVRSLTYDPKKNDSHIEFDLYVHKDYSDVDPLI